MKQIALWLLLALGVATAYANREQINSSIDCWLYYDQCTALRISGLTGAECLTRSDAVAYLKRDRVCLVRSR